MSVKFYPLPFSVTLWCADIALHWCNVCPPCLSLFSVFIHIYIYIYLYRHSRIALAVQNVARECGQAGDQPRPLSSVPVPVPVPVDPVPDDPDPVPVPVSGSEDDGDLPSVSLDHPDPPVPSYPSLTVDDIPRRPRTKHTKRLSTQPTAFPFSSPKVPVIPKSKSVSFRK